MDYQQEIESYKLLLDAERLSKDRITKRLRYIENEYEKLACLCELLQEDAQELKWII